MTVYHGTTLSAAQSIKRDGLKPHRSTAFHFIAPNGRRLQDRPEEKIPLAYVTLIRKVAENFAKFRVDYLATPKGKQIPGTDRMPWVKTSATIDVNAKPALVILDLPDDWKSKFSVDPNSRLELAGLITPNTIPPAYVARIEVIR